MKKISNKKGSTRKRSNISKAGTYAEIGDFWDEHDLSDYWDKTIAVRADVVIESEESLYAVEKGLSDTIRRTARERGISPHTLLNLWLQEKIQKLKPNSRS
jgi:hypothetical protein